MASAYPAEDFFLKVSFNSIFLFTKILFKIYAYVNNIQ